MPEIIEEILDSQFQDGFKPTIEQFKLISQFVADNPDDDLCEVLYSGVKTKDYDPHKFASFLSMLMWATPDNGSRIISTLESWAVSNIGFKVQVAYSNEIEAVLENVKHKNKP